VSIQAVIFDLAGVLLHTIRGTFAGLMAERLGVTEVETSRLLGTQENDMWDMGEMNDDEFFTFALELLNLPMNLKPVLEKFVVDDFCIDQEMLAAVHELHKSCNTALLTNFPSHVHTFMQTVWRVDGAFDHIIASCDVKLIKPDPRIYQLTLERLDCRPDEAVFIDDRPVNVVAAEELGIHGIMYQSREQSLGDLEKVLSINS
jgi:putative hydrolase of the HAD superfamily